MQITLDLYQTLAVAVVALYVGNILKKRIHFLVKFCIPSPVIGGLLFALFSLALYATGWIRLGFDDTLKQVCMVFFFTAVGFLCNLKTIRQGGRPLLLLIGLIVVIILIQNFLSIGIALSLGLTKLVGMTAGSIPMIGGHGTSAAFGPVLEQLGVTGATTLCTAAATFGLVAGSLIGGPIAENLIERHHLAEKLSEEKNVASERELAQAKEVEADVNDTPDYTKALYLLILAVGVGTVISYLLNLTGMTFPIYMGGLLMGAIIRNVGEMTGKIQIPLQPINLMGEYFLSLFLGIAMCTLKLWELWDLALPLVLMLGAQLVFMTLFAYFIVFRVLGKDYDAAVLTAGVCGFGMGATPNAMANMQAVCSKYRPSVKAYLLVPIVGSMFVDFLNSILTTFFINL